jgi:hypothetical protein
MSTENQASTETVQSQTENNATTTVSVEDRLLSDFGAETTTTETNTETQNTQTATTEPTAEEKQALANEAKELGLAETATKEEIEAKKAENAAKPKEDEWSLETAEATTQEEADGGSWKDLIAEIGGEVPQDYSEEKGYEYFKQSFENRLKQEVEKAQKFDREVFLSEYTPEARLLMDELKSGKTLAEINEPFDQLRSFKALSPEQKVRFNLEQSGMTPELVDYEFNKLVEGGLIDKEAGLIDFKLDSYEKKLNAEREIKLREYTENQKQVQEQERNQKTLLLKTALDRVQTYMDRKIPDAIKPQLLQELSSDFYLKAPGTPEQKVDYLLYNKFGKQGIKDFEARVREKVLLDQKSKQHNVPPLTQGNANRVDVSAKDKTAVEQRLEADFGR